MVRCTKNGAAHDYFVPKSHFATLLHANLSNP